MTAQELIEQGIRYETGGVPDRALASYREVADDTVEPQWRAEALRRIADILRGRSEWDDALDAARRSADIARENNLEDLHAEALNGVANVHFSRGELEAARTLYREMLDISGNLRVRGIALQNLGGLAGIERDFEQAEACFVESFECFQRAGYRRGVVTALINYGRAALDRGAADAAFPVLERAETEARDLMDLDLLALARINLGEVLLLRGDAARAEELASAALGYYGTTRNDFRRLEALRLMGDISLTRGHEDSARNFFEAALRISIDIGSNLEETTLRARVDALHDRHASPPA